MNYITDLKLIKKTTKNRGIIMHDLDSKKHNVAMEIAALRKYFATHNLLSIGASNAKLKKQLNGVNILPFILYMAAAKSAMKPYSWLGKVFGFQGQFPSGKTLCPKATPACAKSCLDSAGRGKFANVHLARIRRARLWVLDKEFFLKKLRSEIAEIIQKNDLNHTIIAIRLNGTSDIAWEYEDVIQRYPDIQFYDYTKLDLGRGNCRKKLYNRIYNALGNPNIWPNNYHLTYSISELHSYDDVKQLTDNGVNCAMVTDVPKTEEITREKLPSKLREIVNLIDGRLHDFRFKDPQGSLVILTELGDAKKDISGFVKRDMTLA